MNRAARRAHAARGHSRGDRDAGKRRRHEIARRATESGIGRIGARGAKQSWFCPPSPGISAFDTSHYDLVISVSHAFEKTSAAAKRAVQRLVLSHPTAVPVGSECVAHGTGLASAADSAWRGGAGSARSRPIQRHGCRSFCESVPRGRGTRAPKLRARERGGVSARLGKGREPGRG